MARAKKNSANSISDRKKVIASVNQLLKEHHLGHMKVTELRLEPRTLSGGNRLSNCSNLQCNDDEKKVEVRLPDGRVQCMCVLKQEN